MSSQLSGSAFASLVEGPGFESRSGREFCSFLSTRVPYSSR